MFSAIFVTFISSSEHLILDISTGTRKLQQIQFTRKVPKKSDATFPSPHMDRQEHQGRSRFLMLSIHAIDFKRSQNTGFLTPFRTVFTGVCHFVTEQGGGEEWTTIPPLDNTSLPRAMRRRLVRILLECILVGYVISGRFRVNVKYFVIMHKVQAPREITLPYQVLIRQWLFTNACEVFDN